MDRLPQRGAAQAQGESTPARQIKLDSPPGQHLPLQFRTENPIPCFLQIPPEKLVVGGHDLSGAAQHLPDVGVVGLQDGKQFVAQPVAVVGGVQI